jgi:hypothetical protein
MMMLAALAACATVAPPKTVSDVSCAAFKPISFAQLPAGQTNDDGNKADSDATVAEIGEHNARFDAICPDPVKAPR